MEEERRFKKKKIKKNKSILCCQTAIIGGIVEKGFPVTDPFPPAPPSPSVVPFPVARHRSHGPHWAPKPGNLNSRRDNEEDSGEDGDSMEYDPMVGHADPLRRKEKKGLDFTRWRELANGDNPSLTHKKDGKNNIDDVLLKRPTEMEMKGLDDTTDLLNKLESADMDIDGEESNLQIGYHSFQNAEYPGPNQLKALQNGRTKDLKEGTEPVSLKVANEQMQLDVEKKDLSASHTRTIFSSNNTGDELRVTSIESEIDAENRARLEGMSAVEIAEAQAEIMNKMNPSLIEALRKRGQQKMKNEKGFGSETENGKFPESVLSEVDVPRKLETSDSKDTQRELNRKAEQKSGSNGGSLWDAWSKKVEAVRELRFSLDGDIIEDFAREAETDNSSTQKLYGDKNVSERDYLRTEGDPGALGYTIKEAVALSRSVVPGQRALALHLLASVLDKALLNISRNQIGCTLRNGKRDKSIDWEAVWAFALGPEPELALTLRMSLDDNHNSVVLACAKVIHFTLSCDINERFFDISEKIATHPNDVCTAPIFRSRPTVDVGFLHGGFWKYNTKPSNILPFGVGTMNEKPEGEHTIQDDVFVAGQDFAAGLVRMGILPRICYLLETNPSAPLEDCLLSILIALARHSPTCVDAIMKCPRLLQIIVDRFTMKGQVEINQSKIKSVTLIRVLARSAEKICVEFVENGIFQKMTWHLYRYALSLEGWLNLGTDKCKLSSGLLIEQLRFWKVCIQYGYCVTYFADLFPALCIWLDVPTFEKLTGQNILSEFTAITREAYLVLESLCNTLPNFYSHLSDQTAAVSITGLETWRWSHVGPMVDLALKWIALKSDPFLSNLFVLQKRNELSSIIWVISAVMQMLSSLLKSVIPSDKSVLPDGRVPYLPEIVPRIGLQLIKNGFLRFSEVNDSVHGKDVSFFELLCRLRHQSDQEAAIASDCCLHGLVQVVVSINVLIQLANIENRDRQILAREDRILTDGILQCSMFELGVLFTTLTKLIASERNLVQSIEVFMRGGPAPGVGVGWGASGGGFWSATFLLSQMDAELLLHLLEIFPIVPAKDCPSLEENRSTMQRVNCALDICLVLGPKNGVLLYKALDFLLQSPVLKCLDLCIRHFVGLNKGLKPLKWQYNEEDFQMFSDTLTDHFKKRWLFAKKKKSNAEDKNKPGGHEAKKVKFSLDTIHEEVDPSVMTSQVHQPTSLVVEWAHQRLPLPMHWFLSPISTVNLEKQADHSAASSNPNFWEVSSCGLFFLLGLEAMSNMVSSDFNSSVQRLPVIWKLHSLSVALLAGMDILEDEKSRDVFENLQELYGELLDKSRLMGIQDNAVEFLKFGTEVHESYSTFVETLVESFAGASYGDVIYGRQVAMYLHRCVEAPVRLAAWNALSNVRALDLLPPLEKCLAKAEGYLEPIENDESILEAFVKSWVSGALDRAETRRSVAYTLVLHHLSAFIFGDQSGDQMSLRNKVAKSVLRDYSRKPQHEGMMVGLVRYNKPVTCHNLGRNEDLLLQVCEVERRLRVLEEACEGNSSLLVVIEKLKTAVMV